MCHGGELEATVAQVGDRVRVYENGVRAGWRVGTLVHLTKKNAHVRVARPGTTRGFAIIRTTPERLHSVK